jgi:hypothetical protein
VGQLAGGGPLGVFGGGGVPRRSSKGDNCSGEDSETGMERTLVR